MLASACFLAVRPRSGLCVSSDRQRRDKVWDLESLRELGRLREVMQAPQGDLLRAHCSLRRVFM